MKLKLKASIITALIILILSFIVYGVIEYPLVVGGAVVALGAGWFVIAIWYIVYENL